MPVQPNYPILLLPDITQLWKPWSSWRNCFCNCPQCTRSQFKFGTVFLIYETVSKMHPWAISKISSRTSESFLPRLVKWPWDTLKCLVLLPPMLLIAAGKQILAVRKLKPYLGRNAMAAWYDGGLLKIHVCLLLTNSYPCFGRKIKYPSTNREVKYRYWAVRRVNQSKSSPLFPSLTNFLKNFRARFSYGNRHRRWLKRTRPDRLFSCLPLSAHPHCLERTWRVRRILQKTAASAG